MARKMISVNQILANGNKAHLTKEEIETRQEQEERLKELGKDKIRPPSYLGKRAKSIFKSIVKELESMDILVNIDIYNLAILSNAMEKWIEATMQLNTDDLTIEYTNKRGYSVTQKNPLITVQTEYSDIVRKVSNDFGLTPASRLKIIQQNMEISEDEKEINEVFGDV